MAELKVPVVVDGIKIVKEVIQAFMDGMEFDEDTSEDYKRGFFNFGNSVVDTLEKMCNKQERK